MLKILRVMLLSCMLNIISICCFSYSMALALTGFVTEIADGDTLTILSQDGQRHKVRLYGIDCPERKQAYGAAATREARNRAAGRQITLRMMGKDRHGRVVGMVILPDGVSLQEYLLRAGLAWVYPQYCRKTDPCETWRELETEARQYGRGVWQEAAPTPPWEWRRRKP